jgi:HD-like signal output (HDOD) protein
VIPQLLRSLRDDSISGAELSRQLAQDVVLVAEVIREANSPYYRPSAPVRTIEGAIMLLGQNGMRMLLARVAFRPIISNQSGRFAVQVAPHVWRQSETCALAASMLAPAMRANPFEAYLAGLLHHVGLIVAFRLIDQIYTGAALPRSDRFCAALLANARLLSARIAALWEFPVTVSIAIEQAGLPGAPPLAQVLALADRIGALRMLVDAGQLAADDPRVLRGLDPAAAACFEKLSHKED